MIGRHGYVVLMSVMLLAGALGCQRSAEPSPTHPAAQAMPVAGTVPASLPSAPRPPVRYERPPVDQDSNAGVRGLQTVNLVVTSGGKPGQGVHLVVLDGRGVKAAEGATDDWGEFHTSLNPGSYRVHADAHGLSTQRSVRVDADTHEIELALDGPPG